MKSKLEGAFSVVLAFSLIFYIQYHYYAAQPWYEYNGLEQNVNQVQAVPVFIEYKVNVCNTHDLGRSAKKSNKSAVKKEGEDFFLVENE